MSSEKVIDLLRWMKEKGLAPIKPARHDRFLNPFTRRISHRKNLAAHQLEVSLWIPDLRGMRQLIPAIEMEKVRGTILASAHGFCGAGPGESEALLSLVNDFRRAA